MRTPLATIRANRRPLLAAAGALFLVSAAFELSAQPAARRVRVGEAVVTGAIDPGSGEFIQSAIRFAEKQDLDALVIKLDTPGGLVSTTRDIVKAMLDSNVPILVHVAPSGARAGSAGVFITIAAHVAAMAPATNIGAAHPVSLGGGGRRDDEGEEGAPRKGRSDDEIMAEKIENDLVAFVESLAELRGRNVEWAISAVRESKAVSATKALELKVIDYIASDTRELLAKADGKKVKLGAGGVEHVLETTDAEIVPVHWGLKHRFLHVIGEPTIASILLSLGALGLLLEFYKPGAMVPGIAGAILLLFGVIGVSALPVNVGGIVLLVVGLALFVAELFVAAFGLLGVAGAICFAAGGILLVDNVGEDFFADPDFGVRPGAFLPTAAFVALAALFIGYSALKAWRMKPITGASGLVDELGEVDVAIEPGHEGKVFVHGELWRAAADRALSKGTKVRVAEVNGLTLRVEPVEP